MLACPGTVLHSSTHSLPMSTPQLASPIDSAGGYATQIMVLKDLTRRVYYFRTAQHNHWSSVDLLALQVLRRGLIWQY